MCSSEIGGNRWQRPSAPVVVVVEGLHPIEAVSTLGHHLQQPDPSTVVRAEDRVEFGRWEAATRRLLRWTLRVLRSRETGRPKLPPSTYPSGRNSIKTVDRCHRCSHRRPESHDGRRDMATRPHPGSNRARVRVPTDHAQCDGVVHGRGDIRGLYREGMDASPQRLEAEFSCVVWSLPPGWCNYLDVSMDQPEYDFVTDQLRACD